MKEMDSRLSATCPKKGKPSRLRTVGKWMSWLYPITGFAALIWFLVRVVPKPSRASYPCQRVAAPLASSMVLWLLGVSSWALVFRKAGGRIWQVRCVGAGISVALVTLGAGWVLLGAESASLAEVPPHTANAPIGVARGVRPGRVVWVHNPDVTDWPGPDSGERWHEHVDQSVAGGMLSLGLQSLSAKGNNAAAWDAIFRHHNGGAGYQSGEKIVIKINLTTAHAGGGGCDDGLYNQTECGVVSLDSTANSPQMLHALLDELVNTVGIAQGDITIGDPTGLFVNYLYEPLHADFPDVNYFDNRGDLGRTRAEFTDPCVPYYWSTSAADGTTQDCVLTAFDQATYVINFGLLKSHNAAGFTVTAKNHFGSMLRTPIGKVRDIQYDYFDLHEQLPGTASDPAMQQMGQYRGLVDLMGLQDIGGKTILYLADGVYGGRDWNSNPSTWDLSPFDGDWPSSLFLSMDPVAIESVGFDFVKEQWPEQALRYEGMQDYLHEAALANSPPSGTFYDPERDGTAMASLGTHEHWNNPAEKQYSRNLDPAHGRGIELVYIGDHPPKPVAPTSLTATALPDPQVDLMWEDNSGIESAYHIERSEDQGSQWAELDTVAAGVTRYEDTAVHFGTEYHYRVRAFSSGSGLYSDYSNIARAETVQAQTGSLEVVKNLEPDDDPGRFHLQIDGVTQRWHAGDESSTGKVAVMVGAHTAGEEAAPGTQLADYEASIECWNEGGSGAIVASGDGPGPLDVPVEVDDDIVCTIQNNKILTPANLVITKSATPAAAGRGHPISYTLAFSNTGASVAPSAALSDRVPTELRGVRFESSWPVTPTGTFSYTWALGDLEPGAGGWIHLYGTLRGDLGAGFSFTNTACIDSPAADANPGDNCDAAAVNVVNSAPLALNDHYATQQDTPLASAPQSVLDNDADPEGDPLIALLESGPISGTLALSPGGTFLYTPTLRFSGEDRFSYRASDGLLASDVATATLAITANYHHLYLPLVVREVPPD